MKKLATSLISVFMLSAQAQADDINVWFKIFIPENVGKEIPNVSEKVLTWDSPLSPLNCFSTDNRGFDEDEDALARITAKLKLSTDSLSYDFTGETGVTKEYDCVTGKELDSASASFSEGFKGTIERSDGNVRTFKFLIDTTNPLTPIGSPAIDAEIFLKETRNKSKNKFEYEVSGDVDDFPAFEMYIEHDGQVKTLFRIDPEDGATPLSLYGFNRDIDENTVTLEIE